MPFPEGITTRQDGLGEQYPFLVGEVATEEGQHLDPAYLSDFQSGFFYYDAFLLSFTVTAAEPEPEPDEPCCPPLEEPEPECAPTVERPYTNSPCHAPDCMQAWEDGPTLWDGGGTWWDCEEPEPECDPSTAQSLGITHLGTLGPAELGGVPSLPVSDPFAEADTTSLLFVLTTSEAASFEDFSLPAGWLNVMSGEFDYAGVPIPGTPDGWLMALRYEGVPPEGVVNRLYENMHADFVVLTLRLQPGQHLGGLLSEMTMVPPGGSIATFAESAPADGNLMMAAVIQAL